MGYRKNTRNHIHLHETLIIPCICMDFVYLFRHPTGVLPLKSTCAHLTKIRKNQLEEELDKTEKAILTVAPKPTLFRPPGGSYNDTILKLTRDKGYLTILWSIGTPDWHSPQVGDIVNSVLKGIKPGSIILLHDGK